MKLGGLWQQRIWPAWPGFYLFPGEGCSNLIRLSPTKGEARHISEIISDAYVGDEFEWDELAPDAPSTLQVATEEGIEGWISIIYSSSALPALDWSEEVAALHPTLLVTHDYCWAEYGLMGRAEYIEGRMVAQCHLRPFPEGL